MTNSKLCSLSEVDNMLKNGKILFLAGDEALLKSLSKGAWIGGTIPYFMAEDGGVTTKDKVFVTELPEYVTQADVGIYDETTIENIYVDTPRNGFSLVILPALSPVHLSFALNAPKYQDFAAKPLVGWISGVHLDDLGKVSPKVFNGMTGEASDKTAVVMRVSLPADRVCDLGIINIFSQGDGDMIEFMENTFSAKEALINGKPANLAKYLLDNKADIKLPLVADYCGANINVSFQNIDEENGVVNFYAPLFKGVQYKHAKPISNYVQDFVKSLPIDSDNIIFSCNCILNFLYSELEGKKTGNALGPITFGEVAYQLLNQTMVYLTIQKI